MGLNSQKVTAGNKRPIHFKRLGVNEGLSQNSVMCILQDRRGLMWIGTADGLNRYDGYRIELYDSQSDGQQSLSESYIFALAEDPEGRIWIGTRSGGLNVLDPVQNSIKTYRHQPGIADSLVDDRIRALQFASDGSLWIGTVGGLSRLDLESETFQNYRKDALNGASLSDNWVFSLAQDQSGSLWAGTLGGGLNKLSGSGGFEHLRYHPGGHGLSDDLVYALLADQEGFLWIGVSFGTIQRYDPNTQQMAHYQPGAEMLDPNKSNRITSLLRDQKNQLWFGTEGSGFFLLDLEDQTYNVYQNDPTDLQSLAGNWVTTIYRDRTGIIWVGSQNAGISYFDPISEPFVQYTSNPERADGLIHNVINSFAEDHNGDIWIGTEGGMNRFDPNTGAFESFTANSDEPGSLPSNQVQALLVDHSGTLWVGTEGGGLAEFLPESKQFVSFQYDPKNANTISNNNVSLLFEDRQKRLWIATNRLGGLNRLDPERQNFTVFRHQPGQESSLSSNQITAMMEDQKGNLWFGTYLDGLNLLLNGSERFMQFKNNPDRIQTLSNNSITALHQDGKGQIWIGTFGGLNRFDQHSNSFFHYTERDGLANNVIQAIMEDRQNRLWLSTNKGLSRFDPDTGAFTNYSSQDGLQSNEFRRGAALFCDNGVMFLGGTTGFNTFRPDKMVANPHPPVVKITDFLLFNQSVRETGGVGADLLYRQLDSDYQLVLSHRQNVFSLEFAALHYADPHKNRYAYMLKPFDSEWRYTSADKRFATYTNLDPGRYNFLVRAANKDGVWSIKGIDLPITIQPSPFLTPFAYSLYFLTFASLLAYAWFSYRRKLKRERSIAERFKQLDKLKNEFMAHTSHELQTPLHGIIGLAEALIDGITGPLPDETKVNLALIVNGGRRLSNLVDDILDFSKLTNNRLELENKPVDIRAVVDVVLRLNKPRVGNKALELRNEIPPDFPPVLADENRLQQIFHNIISNAIQFTQDGYVAVSARKMTSDQVEIAVQDTGVGIAKDKVETLFQSLESVEESGHHRVFGGTGLGLSLAKELVQLHGGDLSVESELGKGTTLLFTLPTAKVAAEPGDGLVEWQEALSLTEPLLSKNGAVTESGQGTFRILIVDDEPVIRRVLANHLALQNYRIEEASSGYEALQMLKRSERIDLMLLDILMPQMNGYEVCREVRKFYPMHELPVIFLTAQHQEADFQSGFASGANDYLAKPFNKNELISRVQTHLQLLDITRNLERKVALRTAEIESKNQEIVRTQKQMILQEKMAALGTLTAGMAHEINTPVGIGVTAVSHLEDRTNHLVDDLTNGNLTKKSLENYIDTTKRAVEILVTNLNRAADLIQSFKQVAADQTSAVRRRFNVKNYLREIMTSLEPELNKAGHRVEIEGPDDLEWDSYPGFLAQITTNFVMNSIHHAFDKGQEGVLSLSVARQTNGITLEYRDNGRGLQLDLARKIFDPFFTTARGDGRIGLGLHLVFNLVSQQLGGTITTESAPGKGLKFKLTLPDQVEENSKSSPAPH